MSDERPIYGLCWPLGMELTKMVDPVRVECKGQVGIFEREFLNELMADPEFVRANPDLKVLTPSADPA